MGGGAVPKPVQSDARNETDKGAHRRAGRETHGPAAEDEQEGHVGGSGRADGTLHPQKIYAHAGQGG